MINTLPKSLIEAATRVITPDTHIDVDGEMKHKYNSEGKLIHHTDDGIKNFHRWFGDSKAVDEQGRPQVVYHGTPHDFDKFDKNKIGDGYNRFGSGFYFTGDKKTFDVYSSGDGGNVKPAYLSIKNPQTSSAMSHDQIHNFFSALQDKKFDNGYDATVDHERIKQHALSEPEHAFERLSSSNGVYISKNDWHRGMKSAGIDGVIQNVFKKPEYVVHNPNQIKSAIGNNGSYDITNDSINESIEDPLEFHTDNPGVRTIPHNGYSPSIINNIARHPNADDTHFAKIMQLESLHHSNGLTRYMEGGMDHMDALEHIAGRTKNDDIGKKILHVYSDPEGPNLHHGVIHGIANSMPHLLSSVSDAQLNTAYTRHSRNDNLEKEMLSRGNRNPGLLHTVAMNTNKRSVVEALTRHHEPTVANAAKSMMLARLDYLE